MSWYHHAACRDGDTEQFFPSSDERHPLALLLCEDCPVIASCAADALAHGDAWGIRAGVRLNPNRMRRKRRQLAAIAGTDTQGAA